MGKRNRILAAALGFVATAGAFAAFAQNEAPRDWKHFSGKVAVTGTFDLEKTVEAFPSGASRPIVVYFRKNDGTTVAYRYALLSADDKKAVDVALDLDAEPEPDANSRELAVVPKDGVRRAVLVGVNDYARFPDLRFAGADVELIRTRLLELGFAPENIVALTTQAGRENERFAPNKTNIELELERILAESGPDDMIFVMFTGHGFQTENYDGYAPYVGFAPSDAAPNRATVVDFASTVSLSKLFEELKRSEARFKWVLVDACRENLAEDSPLAGGSAASKSLARSKALRKLEAPPGVAILQSCADGEFSWEKDGHGVFTRTFAESLTELGDANEDGVVTFLEAAERTMTEVKRETSNRSEYETTQTPYLSGNMTRFVLADVKTAEAKERWSAAVEAREKGDYATALTEIDAALELMPNKPEYATEKRAIEALASAEKARREAESEARKAKAEKLLAEAQAAFDREEYATTISKCDEAARFEDLPEISGLRKRAEAEKLLAEAQAAFDRKDYKTAQTKCEAASRLISLADARALLAKIEEALAADDWDAPREAGTLKSLTVDGITYNFRYCPAGTFQMGSPESESGRDSDETQHEVTLDGFWTLETEVTVGMYRSFVKATGRKMGSGYNGKGGWGYDSSGSWGQSLNYTWENPGFSFGFQQTDAHPVTQVDWVGAKAFCDWLARESGLPIRLPSEAEWEYACRAGSTTAYSFGSDGEDLTEYGNVADASAKRKFPNWTTVSSEDGYVFTAPVKTFKPNEWNLYDMHGNVWEWCADWYDADYYKTKNSAQGLINETPGSYRVLRGGGWSYSARYCRSAYRRINVPAYRRDSYGFRLVLGR